MIKDKNKKQRTENHSDRLTRTEKMMIEIYKILVYLSKGNAGHAVFSHFDVLLEEIKHDIKEREEKMEKKQNKKMRCFEK